MEVAVVLVAAIGYLAFRQWLQLNRRRMAHRERLAAIEKGVRDAMDRPGTYLYRCVSPGGLPDRKDTGN